MTREKNVQTRVPLFAEYQSIRLVHLQTFLSIIFIMVFNEISIFDDVHQTVVNSGIKRNASIISARMKEVGQNLGNGINNKTNYDKISIFRCPEVLRFSRFICALHM
jgi:hypothetical protein